MIPGGPMLRGYYKNEVIGSGTDVWKFEDMRRTGKMTDEEFTEIESCMARSAGHCMVMGTASTMTCLAEGMGLTLTGSAAIPAVDTRRYAGAQESGKRIVEMVKENLCIGDIITKKALENAITLNMAIGGSTNAVIHLIAIAGRLGIELNLDDFDRISQTTPLIVNVKPSGSFVMEDFYYAGGVPAVMNELKENFHLDAVTVSGKSLGEQIKTAEIFSEEIIKRKENPLHTQGGTVVLKGNIAPNGAVIKQTAASPHLLKHRGKAIVFNNRDEMIQRINDPDLPVTKDSVLVLKNSGPVGGPGNA